MFKFFRSPVLGKMRDRPGPSPRGLARGPGPSLGLAQADTWGRPGPCGPGLIWALAHLGLDCVGPGPVGPGTFGPWKAAACCCQQMYACKACTISDTSAGVHEPHRPLTEAYEPTSPYLGLSQKYHRIAKQCSIAIYSCACHHVNNAALPSTAVHATM